MQIQTSMASNISNENDEYSSKTRFSSYPKMTLTKEQSSPTRVSFIKDPGSGTLPRSKTIISSRQKSFYGKSSSNRGNNPNHNRVIDFNNNEDFEVERV